MKSIALQILSLIFVATGFCAEPPRLLEKADVRPLALDDAFCFTKTKGFLNDPVTFKPTLDAMIAFERQRVNYGAVTQFDRRERYGQYYTFFWKAARKADLTVRLEYRQQNLGSYVQAKEKTYPGVKGSLKTDFSILGEDYIKDGKITAWRAVLLENGHIVALSQSFLWN